jgi:hypothetical protein
VSLEDMRRAYLIAAVQQQSQRLVEDLDRRVSALARQPDRDLPPGESPAERFAGGSGLPNHRINGIANSLAWHARRPAAEQRLAELNRELKGLIARAAQDSAEQQLYQELLSQLHLEAPATIGWETRTLAQLRLAEGERDHWLQQLRLLLAQALIQIVQTLVRSRQLRQELEAQGGAIRWQ